MTDRKKEPSPIPAAPVPEDPKRYTCERTDCRYYNPRTETGACNYMMITGKSKIVQLSIEERKHGKCHLYDPTDTSPAPDGAPPPRGEGFRAKDHKYAPEPGKPARAKQTPNALPTRPVERERSRRMRELYEQGLNDCEIAEAMGITSASVWYWRSHRGLVSHRVLQSKDLAERMRELYERGLNDVEIACGAGCMRKTVMTWRAKNGLKNNLRRGKP